MHYTNKKANLIKKRLALYLNVKYNTINYG
jgi:hypothetical protein